jgi:hypothetical protein
MGMGSARGWEGLFLLEHQSRRRAGSLTGRTWRQIWRVAKATRHVGAEVPGELVRREPVMTIEAAAL